MKNVVLVFFTVLSLCLISLFSNNVRAASDPAVMEFLKFGEQIQKWLLTSKLPGVDPQRFKTEIASIRKSLNDPNRARLQFQDKPVDCFHVPKVGCVDQAQTVHVSRGDWQSASLSARYELVALEVLQLMEVGNRYVLAKTIGAHYLEIENLPTWSRPPVRPGIYRAGPSVPKYECDFRVSYEGDDLIISRSANPDYDHDQCREFASFGGYPRLSINFPLRFDCGNADKASCAPRRLRWKKEKGQLWFGPPASVDLSLKFSGDSMFKVNGRCFDQKGHVETCPGAIAFLYFPLKFVGEHYPPHVFRVDYTSSDARLSLQDNCHLAASWLNPFASTALRYCEKAYNVCIPSDIQYKTLSVQCTAFVTISGSQSK